ncbi:crossover junction endonuclease EME1-like [Hyalella azteca]|uniref:Crossover junction endonuclease EME1-like n=1 Tax=Hyalella azteca TaxID=294128 RepID=A0A979FTM3_HYAAZ|nr:crossover junction endonuclease EME1-like [Hyalella azteca]
MRKWSDERSGNPVSGPQDFLSRKSCVRVMGSRRREILEDNAAFAWYAEGSNVCPVRINSDGVGLLKLWQQQLRQFTNVGLETAQAIARAYPAPRLLIQAYEGLPAAEAAQLLADIAVVRGAGPCMTTRKLGKELSKKIYTFFTSSQPCQALGS